MPNWEEIRRMVAERSGLAIEVMPSLHGREGEWVFYSEEIWQSVSIRIDQGSKRVDFKWRNSLQGKEYLRLVLVKCLCDLGGKSKSGTSLFEKKMHRTVAHLPHSNAKKLLFARLIGLFSLQLDKKFYLLDEAIQRRRQVG